MLCFGCLQLGPGSKPPANSDLSTPTWPLAFACCAMARNAPTSLRAWAWVGDGGVERPKGSRFQVAAKGPIGCLSDLSMWSVPYADVHSSQMFTPSTSAQVELESAALQVDRGMVSVPSPSFQPYSIPGHCGPPPAASMKGAIS